MRLFLLFITFSLVVEGSSQTDSKTFSAKNAVYLEVGGNARWYAVNYGRIFHQKEMFKLSASAGFSMWRHNRSNQPYNTSSSIFWLPVLPLEISALIGRSTHHLEVGTGITPFLSVKAKWEPDMSRGSDEVYLGAFIPLRLGYRYQKPEGGFFFRIAYTPLFRLPVNLEGSNYYFSPIFAGISFGKSF